ncbi:hypothetical protein [Edwardsiella tarda]|uniref:hypothetical protein n=1 Tax=Edwardsiella tarda TaxID=636 RepID=UPI00055304BB|nr:hypothetical protein [Edwardsiella tarda]
MPPLLFIGQLIVVVMLFWCLNGLLAMFIRPDLVSRYISGYMDSDRMTLPGAFMHAFKLVLYWPEILKK